MSTAGPLLGRTNSILAATEPYFRNSLEPTAAKILASSGTERSKVLSLALQEPQVRPQQPGNAEGLTESALFFPKPLPLQLSKQQPLGGSTPPQSSEKSTASPLEPAQKLPRPTVEAAARFQMVHAPALVDVQVPFEDIPPPMPLAHEPAPTQGGGETPIDVEQGVNLPPDLGRPTVIVEPIEPTTPPAPTLRDSSDAQIPQAVPEVTELPPAPAQPDQLVLDPRLPLEPLRAAPPESPPDLLVSSLPDPPEERPEPSILPETTPGLMQSACTELPQQAGPPEIESQQAEVRGPPTFAIESDERTLLLPSAPCATTMPPCQPTEPATLIPSEAVPEPGHSQIPTVLSNGAPEHSDWLDKPVLAQSAQELTQQPAPEQHSETSPETGSKREVSPQLIPLETGVLAGLEGGQRPPERQSPPRDNARPEPAPIVAGSNVQQEAKPTSGPDAQPGAEESACAGDPESARPESRREGPGDWNPVTPPPESFPSPSRWDTKRRWLYGPKPSVVREKPRCPLCDINLTGSGKEEAFAHVSGCMKEFRLSSVTARPHQPSRLHPGATEGVASARHRKLVPSESAVPEVHILEVLSNLAARGDVSLDAKRALRALVLAVQVSAHSQGDSRIKWIMEAYQGDEEELTEALQELAQDL